MFPFNIFLKKKKKKLRGIGESRQAFSLSLSLSLSLWVVGSPILLFSIIIYLGCWITFSGLCFLGFGLGNILLRWASYVFGWA
jgi:hypothetical protein